MREEQQGEKRADYGTRLLPRLGQVLMSEFGRGFAEQSLRAMRQFYLAYPIRSAVRSELGWTHYRTLMRLPDEQRTFYEQVAGAGRWSSRELDKQSKSMLYERTALSRKPDELLATVPVGQTALEQRDAFKDPYILDFLGLEDTFSEKDLEAALVLAESDRSSDERIKVAQYLLLNSEEAIKTRLAQIRAAYERVHGRNPTDVD